jgi:putative oxidoreductase
MSIFEPASSPWPARALAVLRIVAGVVFISAGTMKLFGFPPSGQPGLPLPLLSQAGLAGVLETFGGLAIVLGFCTRPVAFVLSGEMAVAYFQFHFPRSFFPTVNQGMPAILYCFLYLYLTFAGPGAWGLDGYLARRRQRTGAPNG